MKSWMKHPGFVLWMAIYLCRSACSDDPPKKGPPPQGNPPPMEDPPFDIDDINDTYPDVAPFESYPKWGPYNVHDPTIIKDGDYFYCYNTDVGFGIDVEAGGGINGDATQQWIYTAPTLTLQFSNATYTVHVERGRDWENKKECLIFSGLSETGMAIWGKKRID